VEGRWVLWLVAPAPRSGAR